MQLAQLPLEIHHALLQLFSGRFRSLLNVHLLDPVQLEEPLEVLRVDFEGPDFVVPLAQSVSQLDFLTAHLLQLARGFRLGDLGSDHDLDDAA
jgi:hypothetical protein